MEFNATTFTSTTSSLIVLRDRANKQIGLPVQFHPWLFYWGWAFLRLLTDEGEGGKNVHPSKICHTFPTMMKLGTGISYLKKTYKSRDTPLEFCWHQQFSTSRKSAIFVIPRNTDIACILIHNFKGLKVVSQVLKVVLQF